MLRDRWTAQSRRSLLWMGLIVGAVPVLLAVGGCGGSEVGDGGGDGGGGGGGGGASGDLPADLQGSSAVEQLSATPAVTILDLPDLVLQRSDVPIELELVEIEQDSEFEYKVEYELADPEASLTGLRSVSSVVRLGTPAFPSLDDVRALQRHTLDAAEVPTTTTFGDESMLYRITVLADHAEHHIYYGYINRGGLGATLIGVQGTLPDASPAEIEATVDDILLLMESQADRLIE